MFWLFGTYPKKYFNLKFLISFFVAGSGFHGDGESGEGFNAGSSGGRPDSDDHVDGGSGFNSGDSEGSGFNSGSHSGREDAHGGGDSGFNGGDAPDGDSGFHGGSESGIYKKKP